MSFATKPTFVKQAFANNGIKNTIPDTTANEGYASYDEGFPAITMQPKESGGLPPRGQDMNGILNELSQFNQYQQMGGTYGLDNNILTNGGYAKNSIVYQDDGIYRSLVDNNIDNFVNNPSVIGSTWHLIVDYNSQSGTNGVPGQLSYFARTDIPTGWLRCDGAQYTRTSFPNFWDDYLTQNKLPTCSYAEYATEISDKNGNCGKFAVDLVNLTFKVPTIQGKVFISQALASGDIGKFNQQTLTNTSGNNGIGIPANIQFPIFVCVANIQVPVSEAQYNGFISNLNQKVDLDGSNADFNNLSDTAKENLITMLSPNYQAKITRSVNTYYTAAQAGYIFGYLNLNSDGTFAYISVDGANIGYTGQQPAYADSLVPFFVFVPKGKRYNVHSTGDTGAQFFYCPLNY